jgi:hypothetical protein
MSPTADEVVDRYLARLRDELSDLPRAHREEVVEDISEHIANARSTADAGSEAEVRTLLDRLGDPAEIAADARDRFGVQPPRRAGFVEIAALVLLLLGGFFFVGWLVGVVLLWLSDAWTTRDKLIGTLVVPGGLALPGLLAVGVGTSSETCTSRFGGAAQTCTSDPAGFWHVAAIVGLVVLALAPFATTVYLSRRMGRRPALSSGQ